MTSILLPTKKVIKLDMTKEVINIILMMTGTIMMKIIATIMIFTMPMMRIMTTKTVIMEEGQLQEDHQEIILMTTTTKEETLKVTITEEGVRHTCKATVIRDQEEDYQVAEIHHGKITHRKTTEIETIPILPTEVLHRCQKPSVPA